MFGLAEDPRPKHPMRGSPRMFKVWWIEKYFSRVHPLHVVAIWLPIIGYSAYRSIQAGARGLPFAGALMAGVLLWTLIEYLLHRFVFHFTPHGKMQEDLSFLIHGIHHDYPWDADRLVMPPAVSLSVGALLYLPIMFVAGPVYFGVAFAGTALGYVWYDLAHYAFHHIKPRTALGRYLRSYHLIHHFKTHTRRYGVSTPLWDYVFGTAPEREEATKVEA
jgi:sterol desaturase/sphingolipid hydroxylase (fatty acid hydroxylase superfamily)